MYQYDIHVHECYESVYVINKCTLSDEHLLIYVQSVQEID